MRLLDSITSRLDRKRAPEPAEAASPPSASPPPASASPPAASPPPASPPSASPPPASPPPASSPPPAATDANSSADRGGFPRYVDWYPAPANAIRLFEGEWSSAVPGLSTGSAQVFDDARITWLAERMGGLQDKRVLELGSFEGGHTFMMSRLGARVTAIEGNARAWLRGLAVKELLGFPGATMLLGDFVPYVRETTDRYDFVLASGVLYHMLDPITFLYDLSRLTDHLGIWTHYFDPTLIATVSGADRKFAAPPDRVRTPSGREVELYGQSYLEALDWIGFCGGPASGSTWLSREAILGILADQGFTTDIALDHHNHPNGPAFCLFASR